MTFSEKDISIISDKLAKKEKVFQQVIDDYGYPPFFKRQPGFASLVQIILEQQVSLASARAAYQKLKGTIGTVTPSKISHIEEQVLKDCYFSRQKIVYVKELANAIQSKKIDLNNLATLSNEAASTELMKIKGIGYWTAEVYLMMCMQRIDLFPIGDIALINSIKHIFSLPKEAPKELILEKSHLWKPYRTIASFLLWHAYIQRKGIKL
jgi:DNA-3-methyladenine glycosylase II